MWEWPCASRRSVTLSKSFRGFFYIYWVGVEWGNSGLLSRHRKVEPVRFRPAQIKFESKIFWTSYFLSETCWKQFQINIDADVPTLKLYGQWNQLGWLLDELTAYATIAQLVERRTCNADVVGSSPTCSLQFGSVTLDGKGAVCKTVGYATASSSLARPITFNFILGRSWQKVQTYVRWARICRLNRNKPMYL